MRIDDPRIQQGWLAHTSRAPEHVARIRAWRRAHPEFASWTVDWFAVACAPDVVADDFDPVRGTGSAFLFRTRSVAEEFGAREEIVASGARPIQPVHYADVSRVHAPDVVRQECAARVRRLGDALAAIRGAGRLEVSGVFYAPRTDEGAAALALTLLKFDDVQAWARDQETRLVEEAEGARAYPPR